MHELLKNQLTALATLHNQQSASFQRLQDQLSKKTAEVERLSQQILETQEQSERAIVEVTNDKPQRVQINIIQTAGYSPDLYTCLDQFDERRAGDGLLTCLASDQQMIDQITEMCNDFMTKHQPHFDWCEMKVVVENLDEDV
jgi:TolA-binding protein